MPRDIVALMALVALASLASAPFPALAQVSDPVHHDRVVTGGNNKFLDRQTLPDTHDDDEAARPRDECPANVRLRWMTEVSSSVYATPVIADLHSDGHRQIVVPSFVHHLEVLEGENGARAGGAWPAFHKSTVHASPVVVDTRARGLDIMLPTYDGQVLFFDRDGDATRRRLTLPPLPVKRNWYVHLAPDHVDHSAPDVGAATREAFASGFGKAEKGNGRNGPTARKGSAPRRRLLRAEGVFEAEDEPAPGAEGEHELTAEAEASFAVFGDEDAYAEHADAFGEVVRGEASDASEDEDADYENAWLGADGDRRIRGIPPRQAGVGRGAPADLAGFAEKARPAGASDPARARARARVGGRELTRPRFTPSPGSSADRTRCSWTRTCCVRRRWRAWTATAATRSCSRFPTSSTRSTTTTRGTAGTFPRAWTTWGSTSRTRSSWWTTRRSRRWRAHLDLSTDAVPSARARRRADPRRPRRRRAVEIVVGVRRVPVRARGGRLGRARLAEADGRDRAKSPSRTSAATASRARRRRHARLGGGVSVFGEEAWETHLASLFAQGVTIGDVDGDGRMEVVVGTSSGAVHVLRGTRARRRARSVPFVTA